MGIKQLRGVGIDEPRVCIACNTLKAAINFTPKNDRIRHRRCRACVRRISRERREETRRLNKMERERLYGKPEPAQFATFWKRVNKRGKCWLWTGPLNAKGYGQFKATVAGLDYWSAHRISWAIHKGEIPEDMHVLHNCDNPWCVNPDHLRLGTNQENVDDKKRNGRQLCGERMNTSKLTPAEVQEIRLSSESNAELGRRYGINPDNVKKIKNGTNWKHLPWPDDSEQRAV